MKRARREARRTCDPLDTGAALPGFSRDAMVAYLLVITQTPSQSSPGGSAFISWQRSI